MVKIHTRFQTKTAQKPYPLGQHITVIAYIGEYPPTPTPREALNQENESSALHHSQ